MESYLIKWLILCFFLLLFLLLSKKLLGAREISSITGKNSSFLKKLETVHLSRGSSLHLFKLGEKKVVLLSETAQASRLICKFDLKDFSEKDLDLISSLEKREKIPSKSIFKESFERLKSKSFYR